MVPKSHGVKSAPCGPALRCACRPAPRPSSISPDYLRANNMSYTPVVFERGDEAHTAYEQGRRDTPTTDQSGLYAERIGSQQASTTTSCYRR